MLSILLYIGEIVSANILKVYKNDNALLINMVKLALSLHWS